MLEANPSLGWRDVQDLLIRTAATTDVAHESWTMNVASLRHSPLHGFGLVDAGAAVLAARERAPESCARPHALVARTAMVGRAIPRWCDSG